MEGMRKEVEEKEEKQRRKEGAQKCRLALNSVTDCLTPPSGSMLALTEAERK